MHGAALGQHAVFAFYILSGFLITRVLNERYHFDIAAFAGSRFLRLYPIYLAATLMACAIMSWSANPVAYHPAYQPAGGVWGWVRNFLLVPMYDLPHFRIVPVSWSVAVEIVNYGLLAAFTARRTGFAWTAFALGIAFHIYSIAAGQPHADRYFPWWAAVLPFSLGALAYFYSGNIAKVSARFAWALPATLAVFGLCLVAAYALSPIKSAASEIVFYSSLPITAVLVVLLSGVRQFAIDVTIGDLAYPIFVTHDFIGLALHSLTGAPARSAPLFLMAAVALPGLAALLVAAQNRFVEPTRRWVKSRIGRSATDTDQLRFGLRGIG